MSKRTISEILIFFLKLQEVDYIFGVPGSNMDFLNYISKDNKIDFISNKEEKNSVYMAMGYSKTSNKIGCCFASLGPGVFNLIPGVISAYYESTPILVIGGQNSIVNNGKNIFQEASGLSRTISQINQFKDITLYSTIIDPKKIYFQLSLIHKFLHSPRPGPVYLEFPQNLMNLKINFNKDKLRNILIKQDRILSKKNQKIDLKKVKLLCKDICLSKQPVLIIGAGAKNPKNYIDISNKFSIPIVTTFKGKDKISNNSKNYLGCIGLIGAKDTNNYVLNSDLIIAVGTSFGQFSTDNWKIISPKTKIYRIDAYTKDLTQNYLSNLIQCDLSYFSEVFLKEMNKSKSNYSEINRMAKDILTIKLAINKEINPKKVNSNKIRFIKQLRQKLPKNAIIVSEDIFLVGKYFSFFEENTNINFTNLAPIGCSLAGAIGAKLAAPNKQVAVILGDGGFNMSISELNTILNYNINLFVFILNNSCYGIVYKYQKYKYSNSFYTEYKNPDYKKLGLLYNFKTQTIKNGKLKGSINFNNYRMLFNIIIDKDEKINIKIY